MWPKERKRKQADQVGEVVSVLAGHQPAGVAEARDVLDVGLKTGRIRLEHDINERGEEVVRGGRLVLGDPDGAEDVFTAACNARQFVSRNPLRIHLDDVCKRECKGFGLYPGETFVCLSKTNTEHMGVNRSRKHGPCLITCSHTVSSNMLSDLLSL